jgi:Flp pilus assembly protein TadG
MNRQIRKRPPAKRPLSPRWRRWLARSRDESGSVAVITAICLVFLVGFVALVLDVGHLYAVRSELQNAADAAALAGARALFPINGYPDANLILLTDPPYCDLAVTSGRAAAASNQAGGVANLATAPADIETGIWDWNAKTFTPDATPSFNINAVRAKVRRDAVANQPVASWFASILGFDSTPVNAVSVAAVGYIEKPEGAYLPIFVRTDDWTNWTKNAIQPIQACPDPSDTFAWCAPVPESANANYLVDAVKGVDDIAMPSSDSDAPNNTVNLSNGQLGSVEHAIKQQINDATSPLSPYANGVQDSTGATICYPGTTNPVLGWPTYMLTGARTDSDPLKMNQQASVDGFVPVIVTDVVHEKDADGKPQWVIKLFLLPDYVKFAVTGASPGGKSSQLYATQPVITK